jgi:hypothetical protein
MAERILMVVALISAVAVIGLTAACSDSARTMAPPPAISEIASPAGPGSGQPHLFADAEGRLLMSWIEPGETKRHRFRFAERHGGRWSAPVTIAEGDAFFVNWADVPSILRLPDGRLAAHWLEKSGPGTYAYDVRLSMSEDGATWPEPITPHRDGTQTEHGFASLFPRLDGQLGLVWLDGREMAGASHGGSQGAGAMTLRATGVRPSGLENEVVLDDRVCECCPTAAVRTSRGVVVAYRDRSETEVRDISVVRYEGGAWTSPQRVHRDDWVIPGCPVNGPALSSAGDLVALAWFTAADQKPQVLVSFSTDAGASFGGPIRADDGVPLGRVDVELLPDGGALASWIEFNDGRPEVRVRRLGAGRAPSRSLAVASVAAERTSGYPRMVRAGDEVVFAWTEGQQVRVATAPLAVLSGQP